MLWEVRVMDERLAYVRLVRKIGKPAPTSRVLRLAEPLDDSPETDCWTHAAEYARRTGARYVEGTCLRYGRTAPQVHAWCEEDTAFGPRVVETTMGYEQAHKYFGVTVDLNSEDARRAEWGGRRYSVLELLLAT
jgi:hypothetical protein